MKGPLGKSQKKYIQVNLSIKQHLQDNQQLILHNLMPKITACIWNLEENTNELFNSRSQYYGKTLQTVNEFDHPGAHTMKANES